MAPDSSINTDASSHFSIAVAILAPPPVPCRPQRRHRSPPPQSVSCLRRHRASSARPAARRPARSRAAQSLCTAPPPQPSRSAVLRTSAAAMQRCRVPQPKPADRRPPHLVAASSLPDEHFFLDYDAVEESEFYPKVPPSLFSDQGKSSNPPVKIVDHH
ncbi:hypothetical protein GUJ93_ZPchr0013g35513 [Zizania palustris]|uniref:Uncharacterized protein n=1 Tax=Zizania palustris TaxID=103762 RepID=A0A8J5WQG3_ZIZPA|nr:hypothetical protein GUJ93_ZPchr0013g35513 [Zizania palustris]